MFRQAIEGRQSFFDRIGTPKMLAMKRDHSTLRNAEHLIGEARKLAAIGNLEQAIFLLRTACRDFPDDKRALPLLIRNLRAAGRLEEALAKSNEYCSKSSQDPAALFLVAQANEWKGNHAEAVRKAEYALSIAGSKPVDFQNRIRTYLAKLAFREADHEKVWAMLADPRLAGSLTDSQTMLAARSLTAMKRDEEAADWLRSKLPHDKLESLPLYWYASGRCAAAQNDGRSAIDALRKAAGAAEYSPALMLQIEQSLLEFALFDEIEWFLRKAIQKVPGNPSAYRRLIPLYLAQDRNEDLLETAKTFLDNCPDEKAAHSAWANALLKNGRCEDALRAIETYASGDDEIADSPDFLTTKFDAMIALAQHQEALSKARRALEKIYNAHIASVAITTATKLGKSNDVRELRRLQSASQTAELPSSLKQALESCSGRLTNRLLAGSNLLEDVWQSREQGDRDRLDWYRKIAWGFQANAVLRKWWSYGNESQRRQIDELVTQSDISGLQATLSRGKGTIITSSHLGPMVAGVRFYQTCGLPLTILGTGGTDPYAGTEIIERIDGDRRAVRELYRALDRNELVGITADIQDEKSASSFKQTFLGREFAFGTLVPSLAYRRGVPTFWAQPLWKDGKVAIEFIELPSPGKDESRDAFLARWMNAYAKKVFSIFDSDPENLTVSSGWLKNVLVNR